jgi:hypothetical protein
MPWNVSGTRAIAPDFGVAQWIKNNYTPHWHLYEMTDIVIKDYA